MAKKLRQNELKEPNRRSNSSILTMINPIYNLLPLNFLLFFIYNMKLSNCATIQLKVNEIGNHQIFSEYYDIEKYYPFKISINDEVQILRDKKVLVEKLQANFKNYEIKIEWKTTYPNLTHMFANLSSITAIKLDNMFAMNCDLSYMFYNCTNLQNISITNTLLNAVNDMSHMFFNCHSLQNFSFDSLNLNSIIYYIDISYIFFNCSNIKYLIYGNNYIPVRDMQYSFYNCISLNSINLNKFISQDNINMSYTFYNCYSLNSVSIENNNLKVNDIRYMFYNNTALENLIIKFNSVSNSFYNMSYAFYNCVNLLTLNFDNWYIQPNDMRNMFYNCSSLNSIELKLGTSDTDVNMTRMFYNCNNITIIEFNIGSDPSYYFPNDLHAMFYNCTNLTKVSLNHFNTDKVLDMSYMFFNCINLENFIKDYPFHNYLTKNLKGMFQNCKKLESFDLPDFSTSTVEIMWAMFKGCSGLKEINLNKFDTSQVTDMESMFEGCSNLTSLSLNFNTSKVQYMNKMFKDCINLQTLQFPCINTSSIGTMHQMFSNCHSLEYLNLFNLTERGQSIIDMFDKASTDFKVCVKEHENIPKIFDLIYNLGNTSRDCKESCYGEEWRIGIEEKKYCCPKFRFEDSCYDKCPGKTRTTINDPNDKICKSFVCDLFYSYEQDDCISDIPEGYYKNDTQGKTIDKCHKDCVSCKGKGIDGNSNCTKCNESLYIYKGNCYENCTEGFYNINGKDYCKCFDKKCLNCTEESLEYDLCITCNTEAGYYQKIDENITIGNFKNCYKEPDNYYLNENTQIYERCYESCKYCTKLGNPQSHYCKKCNSDYSFSIKMENSNEDTPLFNCYPNCTYYYYFDEEYKYKCTLESKCPKSYGKLIYGERECVKNCSDLPFHKKEYRKTCYETCPVDPELLIEVGDLCRAACPLFDEPFEMVEEQICVSNCTIMERKDKKCITNYVGNRTNAEIQDKVLSNLMEDIIENFDYTFINDYTSIILEETKHLYEIITTQSKVQSLKTSTLDLKYCETILKRYYDIPLNESLYILKLDAYRDGQTGPTVEYQVYYPLNKIKLEQLDLTLCEGEQISILIAFNMTEEEEDLYNKNSGYYNDICYTFTSDSGTDLTLEDRQQEFSQNNKSLCEEGCEFVKYHKALGQVECSCEIKTNLNLVSDIEVDKTKLYEFLDLKKIANFDVMKCYNLITSVAGIEGNLGFYLFIPTLIMYFISFILFYLKEFKILKKQIGEIVWAKLHFQYLNYIEVKPKEENLMPKYKEPLFLKFLKLKKIEFSKDIEYKQTQAIPQIQNIENNFAININIGKNDKKKKKHLKFSKIQEKKESNEEEPKILEKKDKGAEKEQNKNKKNEEKQKKNNKKNNKNKIMFNDDIYNDKDNKNNSLNAPPNKAKLQKKQEKTNMITEKDPKKQNIKMKDKIIKTTVKNNEILDSDYENIKAIPRQLTEEEKERIKEILKFNENELNDLTYREALKYDIRKFWQLYFALLKSKHNLITLVENRDYNSKGIKIYLCFFSFSFGYAVNGLFFDDDTMHKIHEDGGSFNFWYQLPSIIYSNVISYILENFLNYLALSEDEVITLKKEKVIKHIGRKAKDVLRTLTIKFFFFYLLSFLSLLVFWYYIACFSAVYKNTQYHLIKDTLIGFVTSMAYPLGICLIPVIFRIPSLKGYSKTKESMYKLSQALLFF